MKSIIYILLSFVLLFSACKTTKQTVKNEAVLTENVQLAISEEKTEKAQEENREVVADQRDVDEKISEKTTVIKFSDPNEKGEQYVLEIAIKELNKHTAIAAIITTEKDAKTQSEINKKNTDNSLSKTDYKSATDIKTNKKTTTPTSIDVGVVLLAFGAIFIIILVLKRFELIKW